MFKSLLTKDDAEPKAKFLSKWYPLWLLADLTSFALIDVKLLLHFFLRFAFISCTLVFCSNVCLCEEDARFLRTGVQTVVDCHVSTGN